MESIKLQSADKVVFSISKDVAFLSLTVKNMVEDTGDNELVPLPNVSADILSKVVEYCEFHVDETKTEREQKTWDTEFMGVDQRILFDIILAANYLHIKPLLELSCQTVADMIKNKSPEEIRRVFNIREDFTKEEQEEVRRENQWAFE